MTKGWVMSTIAGSARDGLGILNNELYVARVIWNPSKWVRSAADSSVDGAQPHDFVSPRRRHRPRTVVSVPQAQRQQWPRLSTLRTTCIWWFEMTARN